MNVAVVGDVHGHLALMYAILGRWQSESGARLDLILQLGDLGAFLPTSKLDQATKRYSARDPEEHGFAEFAGPAPSSTLLDPRPPLVFIPGNHEDFAYLESMNEDHDDSKATYPISLDGRIQALRSGKILEFEAGGKTLRIAGVSGVSTKGHKRGLHKSAHLNEDHALSLAQFGPEAFDILISHDAPAGLEHGPRGSQALRFLIEEVRPRFAFFAHYDWPHDTVIGTTFVCGLGCCSYDSKVSGDDWPVRSDGFALVEWPRDNPRVQRLAPEWLHTATRYSWRRWGSDPKE